MTDSQLIVGLLVEGAVGALMLIAIAFLLSRFTMDIAARYLLVIFLFAAAGAYFGFAITASAGLIWTLVELAQVIVFATKPRKPKLEAIEVARKFWSGRPGSTRRRPA